MKRIAPAGSTVAVAVAAASFATAGWAQSPATSSPTAQPSSVSATAATTALLGAFGRHRIVALGLAHGLRQQEDFVIGLLRHPRFPAMVDSIVVEDGNARFQALADRYIAGGDVSAKALRPVWRDTVGSAPGDVPDEWPAQFFAAVRRLNRTLPTGRRIRVALGDPAFDFHTLHRRHDIDAAVGRRDRVFAAAAAREARGGRHVLLLSGSMHLVRVPPKLFGGANALRILERGAKHRVWTILPYFGGARGQDDFERRYISRWSPIAVRALTGTLGEQPADRILPQWATPSGLTLRSIGDALISFGPCSRLRTTKFSLAQYREPAYRAELNRRSRILTGRPFVPPPAKLSDAPYCPTIVEQNDAEPAA